MMRGLQPIQLALWNERNKLSDESLLGKKKEKEKRKKKEEKRKKTIMIHEKRLFLFARNTKIGRKGQY
jgi:hypothetical protein